MTGPAGLGATFVKRRCGAAPQFFAEEAAGLRWLAQARAVPIPEVLAVDEQSLTLVEVPPLLDRVLAAHDEHRPLAAGW